ncbi:phosphoribosylanthranilate isomerase [Mitsuokella sp. AF33-22]|uniref:phosphoribosylanthranilate isomerase n=1 Tax=Mitsuokella sp. AF33-22 TaxID=2292047 RepID=UPI000E4D49EA|nr:phosphoribosylanthranilate isomerase [Mitsuokella sp. AF33-22]RHM54379.1 phosphoribosylanthranilate isomerase [Mitsuokella sp. AF33-22]
MLRAKLCGMKTEAAARAADEAGADFIGFIFWPGSHRFVTPAEAAVIGRTVHWARKVGVFVDEEPAKVCAAADEAGLDYIQLHGHEDAAYARRLNRPVIKAYRYGDGFSAAAANDFPAEFILVDAYRPGQAGGTGESFDWQRAAAEIRAVEKPVLIAGGISEANVAEAAEIFQPYGVDVSGSLEVHKEKSVDKIRSFMQKVAAWNGRN